MPATVAPAPAPDPQLVLLAEARLHDPYACLGVRRSGDGWSVRAYNPHARTAAVATAEGWTALARGAVAGLFETRLGTRPATPCRLRSARCSSLRARWKVTMPAVYRPAVPC